MKFLNDVTIKHNGRTAQVYVEMNGQAYRILVDYDEGGPNYFHGGVSRRGYYLNIRPITIKENGGVSYNLIDSGLKKMVFEAKAFNRGRFSKLVDKHLYDGPEGGLSDELVELLNTVVHRHENGIR